MSTYHSELVLLREQVLKAIKADQQSGKYAYNGFSAASTHIPLAKLTDDATQAGLVWIIGTLVDDSDRKNRGNGQPPMVRRDVVIQVGYQQSNVMADDIPTLDVLCAVVEQLRDTLKNFDYTNTFGAQETGGTPVWIRNDCLRDQDGTPYHYYMLREGNVFESYFNAYFTFPHI